MNMYNESIDNVMRDLAKQQETILLEQLSDLVSRNLLVIESTQPVLVRDLFSDKIELRQSIKLTLKDKEYIEKLEKENKELKALIEKLKGYI